LPELIADTPEQYCTIAASLAGDISRLITLRGSLREQLLASPLADNVTFTRNLEAVYRKIWLHWCRENRQ
jgi:predicted O-linked N-acetylglucosamine transferase (SPINDLY family)